MSSGFVTESEIQERKKVRQEEWERVRKPDDPEAAPEEPVDNRSLWERLEEQKQKKQSEWDEEHKFKNQFRGLNDDEVDFLDKIDDIRSDAERKKWEEEERELDDFEKRQQELREEELLKRLEMEKKSLTKKPTTTPASSSTKKNSQLKLLAGAVKRKSDKVEETTKKPKVTDNSVESEKPGPEKSETQSKTGESGGGGLLGLGDYGSDSDSE